MWGGGGVGGALPLCLLEAWAWAGGGVAVGGGALPLCLLEDVQARTSSSCGAALDDLQSSSSCATCLGKYLQTIEKVKVSENKPKRFA